MLQNYAIVLVTAALALWFYFKESSKSDKPVDPPQKPQPKVKQTCKRKPHWMDPHLTGSQTVQYSRTRSLGDPIRGDLPIVPRDDGWFSTGANPAHSLHTGAIGMIAPVITDGQHTVETLIAAYENKGESVSGREHAQAYYGSAS
ncbi:hypothetical protein [Largemouth bass virus]|uniref:Uncharacterized protein n=1 Tax=Largemouth bass virus TaxID=176656 RepID=A0A9E7TN36_9VIRU|nr:hypothetical protein [Mandarin fish ranavirus]KIA89194.1 hypothetical protein OA88_23075 [Flavobacterium sp. JRM]QJE49131.1 hypothetical protein LMBV_068 [Largemouth bass virus]WHA35572.1 hypothetical protein MSRaV_84L [Micropterus salmoides ranavirus]WHA35677.1 hypothetical protein SCRaV_84L [Siniperca chuatsi ranavirus]